MKSPILIIAWGNCGRCDDGVALVLAARLAARFVNDDTVEVETWHQLGPELAVDLNDCEIAIFIDAHVCPDRPDVVFERVQPAQSAALDTHRCGPGVLLRLCEVLSGNAPEAYLLTIRAHDTGFGDTLSNGAAGAMRVAEKLLVDFVEKRPQRRRAGAQVIRHA
jgi:hydrogenase maturation protease